MNKLLILPLILFIVTGCNSKYNYVIETKNKNYKMNLEIADTYSKRQKGLMYRKELKDNGGMIFIFEEPQFVSFWMKNTSLSLDILFINEKMEIIAIKEKANPYSLDSINYCTINYQKEKEIDKCTNDIKDDLEYEDLKVKYVIELKSETVKKHNIMVGDKLKKR